MTAQPPDAEGTAPTAEAAVPTRPSFFTRLRRGARNVLLIVLLLFVAYTLVMYNWAYSSGERGGILRKFSRKGWVCKTWEGELAMTTVPGVMPEQWSFTVRDDSVAALVTAAVGKQVVLHYQEHLGLWSDCFGETTYFVDSVRVAQ
jgi:hypothetical protein